MKKMPIGSREWLDLIDAGAKAMGIEISEHQIRQITLHCELLLVWNRKINLTTITEPFEIAVKHVLDSLAPVNRIPENATVLDMGTGGGFPGIPIKIAKPSIFATLLDSSGKKINFVKHVVRTLAMENCRAVTGRVEVLGHDKEHSGKYQVVVCRSFAPLDRILPRALPFLAADGNIIALKGKNAGDELADLKFPSRLTMEGNGVVDELSIATHYYSLPWSDMTRALVVIKKRGGAQPA
jgi:16S rRNA (guanine527-N7)-methyltransferase